jgi:hypothetical protein
MRSTPSEALKAHENDLESATRTGLQKAIAKAAIAAGNSDTLSVQSLTQL